MEKTKQVAAAPQPSTVISVLLSIYILTKSHRPKTFLFTKPRLKWTNGNSLFVFRWGKRKAHTCNYDHKLICTSLVHFAPNVLLFFYSFFPLLSKLHAWTSFSFFIISSLNSFLSHMSGRDLSKWQDSIGLDSPWSIQLPCGCHVFMKDDDDHIFFFFFSPILVSM